MHPDARFVRTAYTVNIGIIGQRVEHGLSGPSTQYAESADSPASLGSFVGL